MLSGATGLCLLSRNFTDNRSCLGDSTLANKPKLKTNTSVRRYYNGFTSATTKTEQTSSSPYVSSDLIKDRLLMEQEVWISVEARAVWEVGGATVRMVAGAAPGSHLSSGSDHLVRGFVHAWPDIRVDGSV